jgi:hypothetical protein
VAGLKIPGCDRGGSHPATRRRAPGFRGSARCWPAVAAPAPPAGPPDRAARRRRGWFRRANGAGGDTGFARRGVRRGARRLLLVAPTGSGKSLVYQLSATFLPGTTLVISPLVSPMHDQVSAVRSRGIAATFLAATLDAGEMRRRMVDMGRRAFELVYAAPERLGFAGFRSLLRELDCPLIAVDEALGAPGAGRGCSIVYAPTQPPALQLETQFEKRLDTAPQAQAAARRNATPLDAGPTGHDRDGRGSRRRRADPRAHDLRPR